ncbi:pseudouridine synthase [Luteolibacter algae]|uniref:Pseudouridine synthase n=1 Tax=Luteolibacter algae TaxID=454151 RepID=A0ABW5D792_9BACT
MTLLQFIAKRTGKGRRFAKAALEAGQVFLNKIQQSEGRVEVGKFDQLELSGEILQQRTARYVMLHKPAGAVSATQDREHTTVIDLIKTDWAHDLHLAGRLDRATTGLVILTNDSAFSESLTQPAQKIPKTYLIHTDLPIPPDAIAKFRSGMSFDKEKIRTQPALVEMLSETSCRLTIYEGKHHQIKRMFLRYGIRVTQLHRETIGPYQLPDHLLPRKWMAIDPSLVFNPSPGHSQQARP